MNVSENNFVNIARNGSDLSYILSSMLLSNTIVMVFYLLIGVSINSLAIYVFFKKSRRKRIGRFLVVLPIADLIACVIGTSFFIAINMQPVNFYGDLLCSFMLGINMFFANLSGLLTFDCSLRHIVMLVWVWSSTDKIFQKIIRGYSTQLCVVFAIVFSIPSFIFYGETDIVYTINNISVSGKICGAARISDNVTLFQAYPIIVLTIYAIEFFVICITHIVVIYKIAKIRLRYNKKTWSGRYKKKTWPGFKYTTTRKIKYAELFDQSNTRDYSKTIDMYEDKDCSMLEPEMLICSTCDDLQNKTKWETDDRLFTSHYDKMIEKNICILDNTIPSIQTSAKPEYIKVKETKTCLSCTCTVSIPCLTMVSRTVILIILVAVSSFPRAIIMILESNDEHFWSELNKTEYMLYNFLYQGFLLKSVLHQFFWYEDPIKFLINECRNRQG